MTEVEFFDFCQVNRGFRIERTAHGEIIVMPSSGGEAGRRNLEAGATLYQWAQADGTGVAFDSSTGFLLPNGSERSPDFAWVKLARWETLTQEQRERFPPLCPDFVGEIRSRTDRLATLQSKMQEYIENGTQLGWLIDPTERKVYVYQPGASVVCLDNPETLTGDPVLPHFRLNLARLLA